MALADRHYMREEYHPPRVTTILIVVLLAAFVIQSALWFYGDIDAVKDLGLTVQGLKEGKIWQIITFQFLHATPWPFHVLFNCLGLYFFGRPVEERFGGRRFLGLYFLSGCMGGLLQVALTAILPRHLDDPVIGASAGVCGMIAIFCSLHPMEELRTWMYFLPITIRAWFFLLCLTGISFFGTVVPFNNIAHAAHLGGILTGMTYIRWGSALLGRFSGWRPLQNRDRKRELVRAANVRGQPWRRGPAKSARPLPPEEFMSKEVDPILDKISAHGMQSLTERERKVLDAARRKIADR
jgi:membrane associated rhomboid family serine protease